MNEELPIEEIPETPLSIGQKIAQARLAKGLEIAEAANICKIKGSFLQFIENDEFDRLPNALTAKGFTKVYAGLLGLNVEEISQQFDKLFPNSDSKAIYRNAKEVNMSDTVDKRAFFPHGMKSLNVPGSTIAPSARTRHSARSKKPNKQLRLALLIIALIIFVLYLVTLYFGNSMSALKNNNLRQQSRELEAQETPEAIARREYDKNKIYIEATALRDTYVTLTTIADDRIINEGVMLRRGDNKSWDGSQYIRVRASVARSLRLTVNGQDEGVMDEQERTFLTTAGEAALKAQDEARRQEAENKPAPPPVTETKPVVEQKPETSNTNPPPAPPAAQGNNNNDRTSLLQNI